MYVKSIPVLTLQTLAVLVFSGSVCAQDRKDEFKLEGKYTVVSGEKSGKPVPADDLKGFLVQCTDNIISMTDKDGKEFLAATYYLER